MDQNLELSGAIQSPPELSDQTLGPNKTRLEEDYTRHPGWPGACWLGLPAGYSLQPREVHSLLLPWKRNVPA